MKKALFMVALYLVPFLSVNADDSNIFENGIVSIGDASTRECEEVTFPTPTGSISGCDFNSGMALSIYKTHKKPDVYHNCSVIEVRESSIRIECFYTVKGTNGYPDHEASAFDTQAYSIGNKIISKTCPPEDPQQYDYTYVVSYDSEGWPDKCASPAQISEVDSCNASSGNEYLTIGVSAPSGCFPQSDGSSCKYDAVDVGGGNQYYALDLEGDCYSDNELPDLEGTPENSPVGEECADYGNGVVGCPEDPENVCESGSSYAGGSVQDCQTGCGMVNDQFMCIDQDSDDDGIPDYKDEDADDGADCPVGETCDDTGDDGDSDTGGGECPEGETCTGGGGGEFDDSGIVAELKKSNKFLETMEKQFKTDHGKTPDALNKDGRLDVLDNDYKLDLDNFIAQGSEELGFVDELKLANMSGYTGAVTNRGCNVQSINIPNYGNWSIDFCELSLKVEPILYFVFGILTVSFIFYRVNDTLRL